MKQEKTTTFFKKLLSIAVMAVFVLSVIFSSDSFAAGEQSQQTYEVCSLATYPDGSYYSTWQIPGMGLDTFQNAFRNKSMNEVTVAVLDIQINTSLAEFGNRILADRARDVAGISNPFGQTGHGSHVTRCLLDASSDNVKVLPINIGNASGQITDTAIEAGLRAAMQENVDVIQLSCGSDANWTSSILSLFRSAYSRGIIVCTAAGNFSTPAHNSQYYINVAAADNGMTLTYRSCYNADITCYSHNDGTSYAAPHVSAVCAMLKGMDRSVNKDKALDIISTMAIDIGETGNDPIYGNGFMYMGDFIQNGITTCVHDYHRQNLQSATCSSSGLIQFTCSKCGTSFTRTEDARHQYLITEPEKNVTCGGEDQYFDVTCKLCGFNKTHRLIRDVPSEHQFTIDIVTITTEGKGKNKTTIQKVTDHRCSFCGILQSEYNASIGLPEEPESPGDTDNSGCTNHVWGKGKNKNICTICGAAR